MFRRDVPTQKKQTEGSAERRGKFRFPMRREVEYKLVEDGIARESGHGETIDIGSGGVSFSTDRNMRTGSFIQLSISWPVLLDDACPMRLVVFGRVVRSGAGICACTVDKYEFRTRGRGLHAVQPRHDTKLERWADMQRDQAKARMVTA
ncbi:MAG TPA: hypothetical protein VKX49_16015 [Bryobacteraceae bacterium]|jgi:hypothetical protein|nr:hypothetical protein [Bryobacteraceae bacterium]